MMANTVEITVQGIDEASSVFSDVEKTASSAFSNIDSSIDSVDSSLSEAESTAEGFGSSMKNMFDSMADNWGKITLGASAAGLGIEGVAQSQAELTNQTERVARATDLTSESARELAVEMQNATFPIDEVVGLMEIASQRGLESAKDIENFAMTWDMVGDSTGENSQALAKASTALEAFGVSANEPEKALDALGYIQQETTSSVTEFMKSLERLAPELGDMDINLNETAALLGYMEQEMGMSGRTARQELRKAVNEADGSLEDMLETIGLSEEEFRTMGESVEGHSEVIEANAQDVADNMTKMQELNSWVEQLTYSYGPLIQGASALTPILLTLGPAIKGVSMAASLFNKVLLANPIGLVITSITALIAIIYLLVTNWEEVSAFLMEAWTVFKEFTVELFGSIGEFFSELWNEIKQIFISVWQSISEWISKKWNEFKTSTEELFTSIAEFFSNIWTTISDTFTSFVQSIITYVSEKWNKVKSITSTVFSSISSVLKSIWNTIKSTVSTTINTILSIIRKIWNTIKSVTSSVWNGIVSVVTGIIGRLRSGISNTFSTIRGIITGVWNTIKSVSSSVWSGISGTVSSIIGTISSTVSRVFGTIKLTITSTWNSIKSATRRVWNGMISIVKAPVNTIIGIINSMINGLNSLNIESPSIPSWVPKYGGKSFSIGFSIPNIPSLATGGIVTSPTLAMVGDAGPDNPEIVAPQKMIRGIVSDELKKALSSIFGQSRLNNGNQQPQPITLILRLGNRDFEAHVDDITRVQNRKQYRLRRS